MISVVKLTKKLSTKQFVFSQLVILIAALVFLGGLYYILNIQYQVNKDRFLAGPVTSLPKTLRVDLDSPDEDSLLFDSQVLVSGQTGPNLDVLITSDSSDIVVKSDVLGRFSANFSLTEGPNKIKVIVFDSTGDSRSGERNVYFSKEKI